MKSFFWRSLFWNIFRASLGESGQISIEPIKTCLHLRQVHWNMTAHSIKLYFERILQTLGQSRTLNKEFTNPQQMQCLPKHLWSHFSKRFQTPLKNSISSTIITWTCDQYQFETFADQLRESNMFSKLTFPLRIQVISFKRTVKWIDFQTKEHQNKFTLQNLSENRGLNISACT